ncbi:hypothetical protein P4O66_005197, partial [Electrophorus voltai]
HSLLSLCPSGKWKTFLRPFPDRGVELRRAPQADRPDNMADGPSSSVQTAADAVHCKLCLSDCPAATVSRLCSCDCVFCTRCLCEYVQQTILTRGGDPITCPDLACKHAGVLLDSEEFSWTPHCYTVVTMWLTCLPCALRSGMPHADAPIKQCPKCRVYIERNQGCAQMLCKSCKHTFCWYCLQNLDGDIFLRHYDKGPCRYRLGHSRASVMWNRTQVAGILVGISVIVLVTSPLLLLASPCILCCVCKPCHRTKDKKSKNKTTTTREREPSASIA